MEFLRNFFKTKRIERKPDARDVGYPNGEIINYQKKIENELKNLDDGIVDEFNKRKGEILEDQEFAFKKRWELLQKIKEEYTEKQAA